MKFLRGRCAQLAVLAAGISLACGCGGQPAANTVQGTITYNGKPVVPALINFKPQEGQPLGGAVQADGTYKFDLPPGEYVVRIQYLPPIAAGSVENAPTTPAAAPAAPAMDFPAHYANFNTSELKLTVGDESPQQADFKLP